MSRWGKGDDAKLTELWRTPHNSVDHTKLDQDSVKAVHKKYFPATKYRNFAPLYRSKARAFGVSLTLDGHRKSKSLESVCKCQIAAHQVLFFVAGSAAAKAQASSRGVPLEDISDDSDTGDEFQEDGDEDDLSLGSADSEEGESEDNEERMPLKKTPTKTKKATPSKAKAPVFDDMPDLENRMKTTSIGSQQYSLDFKLPFLLSTYSQGVDEMVKVEIYVPLLPQEYFTPDIENGGKTLSLKIQVPAFFVDELRVIKSNANVEGFSQNFSEAQAFKNVCEKVYAEHGMLVNNLFGKPFEITMPFVCEERITHWEIQAYANKPGTLSEDLGSQYHCLLTVVVQKLRTKRVTKGGFRIVEPAETDEEDVQLDG